MNVPCALHVVLSINQLSIGSSSRGVYCVVSKTCNVMVLDVPSGLTVNVQFFLPRLSLYNWLLRNILLVRFVTEFHFLKTRKCDARDKAAAEY